MTENPWITTGLSNPQFLAINGYTMYVANFDNSTISKINLLDASINDFITTGLNGPVGLAINGSTMYVSNYYGNEISKINLLDASINNFVTTGLNGPLGLAINGSTMYATNDEISRISQINLSDASISDFITSGLNSPNGLAIDGSTMYVANYGNSTISQINLSDASINDFVTSGLNSPNGLAINGSTMYVSNYATNGSISQINLSDASISDFVASGLNFPTGLASDGTYLYVSNSASNTISRFLIQKQIPCFKEGSKILTDKGYKSVENLRKGDLVKTLKNDYLPIVLIGKSPIYNSGNLERIKNRLYILPKDLFPTLTEDLVLTGCHSLLVDGLYKEQIFEMGGESGRLYKTDDKLRLFTCFEPRAIPYQEEGTFTVYHLALESDNDEINFGIYANGLLVESISKLGLREYSGMEFIE